MQSPLLKDNLQVSFKAKL